MNPVVDIIIVNWLLTRRCPYNCDYCGIVSDTKNERYPFISYYNKNEMSTDYVIETLNKLKKLNKDIFNIFYGGEISLRKDLFKIIDHCNKENINYTIITTNVKKVFNELSKKNIEIRGLTTSLDVITNLEKDGDRKRKTEKALKDFISIIETGKIKDPVAEITLCRNREVTKLKEHLKLLSSHGISSSITIVDPYKNKWYDFSKVYKQVNILEDNLREVFDSINKKKDEYKIHMAEVILPFLMKHCYSTYQCGIDKKVTNLTIDADGSVRLCLRIRGVETPKIKILNYLQDDKLQLLSDNLTTDYYEYCENCCWTCPEMANYISSQKKNIKQLTHV
tara:strand:+ start:1976 stop:2986 length:1011 start_codon:yes stop_codon:yes gene_type:complete